MAESGWQNAAAGDFTSATSSERQADLHLRMFSPCFRHVFAEVLRISAFNSQEQGWRGLWRFHAVPTASGIGRPFKELSNTAFGYATVLSPEGAQKEDLPFGSFRILSDLTLLR